MGDADGPMGVGETTPPAGPDRRPVRSRRLAEAVEQLWALMADDYGLLPDLAVDAVRDKFGKESVGFGSVVLREDGSVPDGFRELAEKEL